MTQGASSPFTLRTSAGSIVDELNVRDPEPRLTTAEGDGRRAAAAWAALAIVVFGVAVWRQFAVLLASDLREVAAAPTAADDAPEPVRAWTRLVEADLHYVVWAVGRNAHTLLADPLHLFDAEPCHPAARALALGEPAVALGLAGILPWAVTRDPVATFNLTLLALCWLAPLAMYWLVRAWTGSPAAGIAAGLLYGFHPLRTGDPVHPYLWETTGTLLALGFGRRLWETGRWRDALGLAAAVSLQLGGSLYALLGGAAVGLPVALAWLVRPGLRALRPAPAGCVLLAVAGLAWLLFHPFLDLRDAGALAPREAQAFLGAAQLLPGGPRFPGWLLLGLALLGALLPARRVEGATRAALVAAVGLSTWLAAGPGAAPLPDLYGLLARAVPVLDAVRAPLNVQAGAHLALAILAGLGAAALLRRVPPRHQRAAAAALVLAIGVLTLRPGAPAFEPSDRYAMVRVRPPQSALRFFEELAARGNGGPLLEVPLQPGQVLENARAVLLSAYHGRRTNACASSHPPAALDEVGRLAHRLPEAAALRRLGDLGFTTVVLHRRGGPRGRAWAERLEARVAGADAPSLRELHAGEALTAWALEPPGRSGPAAAR